MDSAAVACPSVSLRSRPPGIGKDSDGKRIRSRIRHRWISGCSGPSWCAPFSSTGMPASVRFRFDFLPADIYTIRCGGASCVNRLPFCACGCRRAECSLLDRPLAQMSAACFLQFGEYSPEQKPTPPMLNSVAGRPPVRKKKAAKPRASPDGPRRRNTAVGCIPKWPQGNTNP